MAKKTRTKRVYYKCAVFKKGTNYSLEDLLLQSLTIVPEKDRIFNLELHPTGLKLQLNDAEIGTNPNKGIKLHITTHADDHRLSLVPRKQQSNGASVIDSEQPQDGNLMQQEAIAYVMGNHILITGSIQKDMVFDELICQLVQKAKIIGSYLDFRSQFVANDHANQLLDKQHVEYIDLDITTDALKIAEAANKQTFEDMNNVRAILALMGQGAQRPKKSTLMKLRVTGGRITATEDPQEAWINQRAKEILADYTSNYTIKLKRAGAIKADELKIYSEEKISVYGHSVSIRSAWHQMEKYAQKLKDSGLLLADKALQSA